MPRPTNPNAQYTIKPHHNGNTYASTQPPHINPKTGKKQYKYKHWGTIDKNKKFTPNKTYLTATPQEQAKLIFPKDWDLTNITKQTRCDTKCQNRFYGDIWLIEQIANKTGIKQDLLTIFDENQDIVNDILTLAMFPYLTKYNYNRVARWQKTVKTPSTRELTPTTITRLTQSITEQHRIELLKMRAQRLNKDELCAVDSTTRSTYGHNLVDIRWGKNKDHLPLPQTTQVLVYSLTSHQPVFYQTFPGNMPDTKSLQVVLTILRNAGFNNVIYITDRGYDSAANITRFIQSKQSFIMCVKTGQKEVAKIIKNMGEFNTRPETMRVDAAAKIYYKQFDVDYKVKDSVGDESVVGLKLNLYFDPYRRSLELLELDISLTAQREVLSELLEKRSVVGSDLEVRREFRYFDVVCDPVSRVIESFVLDEVKVGRVRLFSGFFALLTYGVGFGALRALDVYGLRDEQEKSFCLVKDQLGGDRLRVWSEEGCVGRCFVAFVSLVLCSYVRFVWKSTRLKGLFGSSLEVLDEMRSVRFIEHGGFDGGYIVSPFVGLQRDVCEVFGFVAPNGYGSSVEVVRKRGRPPKKTVKSL